MAQGQASTPGGPSYQISKPKPKKKAKTLPKSSEMRKLTQKQKMETLENDAMNFVTPEDLKLFANLPISDLTKRGLKKAFFVELTDIQAKSIPVSLKGKDVLGAAQTGSGKTLSFLVPILEMLYRRKWGQSDGLGALIISPTRELAVQIFDVLRSIGAYHSFSAGLVIGGKNLKDEADRLTRMNILVATPGRLLQHMDQTFGFDADNLQMLVLDEADRILDMGFQKTLAALLSHIPKSRQTLLFSATQTQSVGDLARLSLRDPVCIGIGAQGGGAVLSATPQNLEQHYVICELDKKLDILWSFIKTHLQSKILVFLSSCKQVRFVFETFCKMHPGVSLLHMHGKQKQSARLETYGKFTTTSHAVLFATDIAARGLDFPAVDWVLQVDAPEDTETYIHRVGRTARYQSKGKGLLFLMPSEEEGMKDALKRKAIQVQKIKIRLNKTQSIENQLQNLAFQDPEIKYLGQRAFVSYMRSIYLHKDKSIFKLDELPVDRFAESLGLPGAPKIKFYSKEMAKKKKNTSRAVEAIQAEIAQVIVEGDESNAGEDTSSSEAESEPEATAPTKSSKNGGARTKYDRMFERKNQNILTDHYSKLIDHELLDDDGDDFITLKRANHDLPVDSQDMDPNDLSKRKLNFGRAKRAIAKNGTAKKLVFDDEGKPHEMYEMADAEEWFKRKGGLVGVQEEGQKFAEGVRGKMKVTDTVDREEAKVKKREKKRKRKEQEKGILAEDGLSSAVVEPLHDDDGYVSPDFDLPSADEDDLPPSKRNKTSTSKWTTSRQISQTHTIEDEEALALRLLRRH